MKLSTKASLLIVAIGVVLFMPLSSIMVHFQTQALRQAAFNTADSAAENSTLVVTQFVENAQRVTNTLAASLPVDALRTGRLTEVVAQIRKVYQTQNFGNGIFLIGRGGDLLVDYPPHPEVRGRNLAHREYWQRTLATRHGVMSEPYLSLRTGKAVLTFTAPIFDDQGAILAVAACSYDLMDPRTLGAIHQLRLGRTGYVYLFDHSRLMIMHPDPARVLRRDIPLGANRILDQAINGFEGTAETINSRGVPMLLSYRQVPGTPWILGAQIPQAEAYEAISSFRRIMLVTTVLSIALILIVGVLMVRHFTRPLHLLHAAAEWITGELKDGGQAPQVVPLLQAIRARDETGILARTFLELVTHQRRSLGLLKEAASEWARTFDAVGEAIVCLDPDGRVLRINRTAADWFRVAAGAAVGRSGRDLVLGEGAAEGFWPRAEQLDAEHARTWIGHLPQREGLFEFQASPVLLDGEVRGMILFLRDCTQQVQREEDILKRAFFDALTGLPNRALLMDRLQQALAAGQRSGSIVGVLFLDLDHFKNVNDTLGHDAGDRLLQEAAHRLEAIGRKNDTVARLGGDEFVMLISEAAGPKDCAQVADKVIRALATPFQIDGHELLLGTSIGIAMAPGDGTEGPALLKCADAAMYLAKREGRSSYRFHSGSGSDAGPANR